MLIKTYGVTQLNEIPQKYVKPYKLNGDAPSDSEEEKPHAADKKHEHVEKEKKEAKKQEKEDDDDEEKPTKKEPNPLDLLPPSKVVLESWKREFLNAPDKEAVLDVMLATIEPGAYSFFKIEYDKLPEEGKELYMTKNSAGYFIQQIDKARRYSFAVHGVYGVEGNYDVKGLWMFRGTDVIQEMKGYDGFEFYKVIPLSIEENKQLIKDYWLKVTEGDEVDGTKVAHTEYFN